MTCGGHFIFPFLTTFHLEQAKHFFPFQKNSLFKLIENNILFDFSFFQN